MFARSALRRAVVSNTVAECWISDRSWPSRCESARNVSPPPRTSCRTAWRWVERIRKARFADCVNGTSSPSALFRSVPRPRNAIAACCIQTRNAARVGLLKVRKISSSCTVGATFAVASRPSSGSGFALRLPGVSST